jgi:hypothetical protein
LKTCRDVEKEIVFQRPKESQININNETIPSPPSAVQRETYIIPFSPSRYYSENKAEVSGNSQVDL